MKQDLVGREDQSIEDINAALAGGRRLNRMADDLLAVSRLETRQMPLERVECDLAQVVRDAIENVKALESGCEIHLEAPWPVPVVVDENVVSRIVENLVSNGLKNTSSNRPLRVSVSDQAQDARVAFRDEGPGIPLEFREKIFEKFGTVLTRKKQKHHSVGLGLAFCKLAVQAHGGRIGLDSEEGKGSTFWFTLPKKHQ